MPTIAILKQIRSLGYHVSVHELKGSWLGSMPPSIEMHAVRLEGEDQHIHIARVELAEPDAKDKAACILAEMVGI